MVKKKIAVIIMVLAIFLGLAQARNTSVNPEYIQSATAINRVLYSNMLQGQTVELWRSRGGSVSESTWNMTLPTERLSYEANSEGNYLLFPTLPEEITVSHGLWLTASEGVREWLFEQHR